MMTLPGLIIAGNCVYCAALTFLAGRTGVPARFGMPGFATGRVTEPRTPDQEQP